MGSNSFGTLFRITTWGESQGPALGVVIDGCPTGLELAVDVINQALAARAPGKSPYTSPRQEEDTAEILSGLFEGKMKDVISSGSSRIGLQRKTD